MGSVRPVGTNGWLSYDLVMVPMEEFEYQPRPAGTAKDRILWMAEDFNAPLDDFSEYME